VETESQNVINIELKKNKMHKIPTDLVWISTPADITNFTISARPSFAAQCNAV